MGKRKKVDKHNKYISTNDKYLLVGFFSIILLHIIGGFWHSNYSWGFSYWSVVPQGVTIIIGLISMCCILLFYLMRHNLNFEFIDKFKITNKSKSVSILYFIGVTIILTSILYIFRSKIHIYGDGYTVIEFCSTDTTLKIIDQNYLQPLAVYWHQFMFKMLSPFSYFEKENIFALTNVIGGVIGFWGIYNITGLLSRNLRERMFFIIISLSSASIILFFGYVENYTWAMSFMLWSIYYCIRYVNNSSSIYPLLICSIIAFAFHMTTLTMIATIIFVLLYKFDLTKKFINKIKRVYFVSFIIISSILITLMSQLKELTVFVPIWGIENNNYSLISFSHLTDILNLLLLLAPLGLMFLLTISKNKDTEDLKSDSTERVLFIISLLTFLSACFIDPQLGMLRDWDLFSFYGIPLTLLGGYRFSRMYSDKQFPIWIIIASSIVVLVHIVPNIYEKNNPQIAVEYLDKILWEDPHYQSEYQNAFRGLSWGLILRDELKRDDLAGKYYARRSKFEKTDPTSLYNAGELFLERGKYEEAKKVMLDGSNIAPNDTRFLGKLSTIEFRLHNYDEAEKYARDCLKLDSSNEDGFISLGLILATQGKNIEAIDILRTGINLNPKAHQLYLNLGVLYVRMEMGDSAIYYIDKGASLAPSNKKPIIISKLITVLLGLNRKSEAIDYLNELKQIVPDSPFVEQLEKRVYEN